MASRIDDPREQPSDHRRRPFAGSRFASVLVLLLATFVFLASAPAGTWVPVVTVALEGTTLMAALGAANVRRRVRLFAAAVVVIALVGDVLSLVAGSGQQRAASFATSALFVLAAPAAIVTGISRRRVIDIQTIMGALCVYVFLGMLCAFTEMTIQAVSTRPFFAQTSHGTTADFVYFSFVTLTTVGFGDLTPALGLGRAIAALEAMAGQLYLVTVVALLVGNIQPRRLAHAGDVDPQVGTPPLPGQPGGTPAPSEAPNPRRDGGARSGPE